MSSLRICIRWPAIPLDLLAYQGGIVTQPIEVFADLGAHEIIFADLGRIALTGDTSAATIQRVDTFPAQQAHRDDFVADGRNRGVG